jgi:hypothetical protein
MEEKSISPLSSINKELDKLGDGNIKPEARERILITLREYLENTGRANISEISKMLNLSRQTTKNLINEILAEWHEEIEDQALVQSKWIESTLRDIDQNTKPFGNKKIKMINLKSSLLSKLNALQKLAIKEESYGVNIYLVKKE